MKSTETTTSTSKTYNIYPATYQGLSLGREATNRALRRTLSVMSAGTCIYVNEAERTQVRSYARSLPGQFTTKITHRGDYKVTRVA